MIRAILFDLDGTLLSEDDAYIAAFNAAVGPAAAERGFDVLALREAVFGAAKLLWTSSSHFPFCDELGLGSPSSLATFCPGEDRRYQGLREWLPSFRYRAWDTGLRDAAGIRDYDLVDRLSTRYMAECMYHHRPYDGVLALLEALKPQYRLAVITNGFTDLQRQKLACSGMAHSFDTTLISGELGTGKPDPRIFDLALSRLGLDAAEAVMVGDSLRRDIAGARAAGITPIWVRPLAGQATALPAAEDIIAIESVAELPEAIDRISRPLC